jgi:hypothetical protein
MTCALSAQSELASLSLAKMSLHAGREVLPEDRRSLAHEQQAKARPPDCSYSALQRDHASGPSEGCRMIRRTFPSTSMSLHGGKQALSTPERLAKVPPAPVDGAMISYGEDIGCIPAKAISTKFTTKVLFKTRWSTTNSAASVNVHTSIYIELYMYIYQSIYICICI